MLKIKDAVDATEPFEYRIDEVHCCKAVDKNVAFCVNANALNGRSDVRAAHVFRGIAYLLKKGDALPTRYQLGEKARELVEINDLHHTKAALLRALKKLGNVFVLEPPRPRLRLEFLRSPEFKIEREESRRRRKAGIKRKYRKPKPIGLRHGGGLAHVWEELTD